MNLTLSRTSNEVMPKNSSYKNPLILFRNSAQFVKSIQVVGRSGNLRILTNKSYEVNDSRDGTEKVSKAAKTEEGYMVSRHNGYVTSILFRPVKSVKYVAKANKSYVDGSKQEKFVTKTKLSAYILDGGDTFHDSVNCKEESNQGADTKKDMDERIFTRTISRKRIINRIRSSNYGLEDIPRRERTGSGPLHIQPLPHLQTSGPSTLSKIFERMHSLNPAENAYVSITDSMYQSLQNMNKPLDGNNNNNKDVPNVCPILVANILATHAETYRHAGMRHCGDCNDYVESLREAMPYLEPRVFGRGTDCSVHTKVSIQFNVLL